MALDDWREDAVRLRLVDVLGLGVAVLIAARGYHDLSSEVHRGIGYLWVAGCIVAPVWRPAWIGLAATALAGYVFSSLVGDGVMQSGHVALIFWVTLTLGLAGRQVEVRDRLLTITCAAVYLFSGLHKINPSFIGAPATGRLPDGLLPGPVIACAVIASELALATLVWRRSRLAVPAAAIVHVGIIVTMAGSWHGIASFNALMAWLVFQTCWRRR